MTVNNSLIRENSELRRLAREKLKGKWGTAVLLYLIFSIICGLPGAIPYIGPVIGILISGPLMLGLVMCFISLIRDEPFTFEKLFDGFKNFSPAVILQILISIFTFLWTLLLIIPGIIAQLRYSMAFYILNDNPQLSSKEALEKSKVMMNGYKGKLFSLYLSFIGWGLLCCLTLGIGFLWLYPYIQTSVTYFYQDMKEASSEPVNTDSTFQPI